jgi:hypothetical protein
MKDVPVDIQRRQVGHLLQSDSAVGEAVARRLGFSPEELAKAAAS